MQRQPLTEKLILLGVDGMEPRTAKRLMDEGKMPALKQFVERGAAREDLMLLGAMPTVTPPLWTTLATGAYPSTHGITCFFAQDHQHLDTMLYNLDSRKSKAEPLWNVLADEANKKALVWHWPGSSWPPTTTSPNLHVVDGVQPAYINGGLGSLDIVKIIAASDKIDVSEYLPNTSHVSAGQGCIIENAEELAVKESEDNGLAAKLLGGAQEVRHIIMEEKDDEIHSLGNMICDTIKAAIKPASGWVDAPAGAKEFVFFVSKGLERRYGLLLPNDQGEFDTVAMYRSKKDDQPYLTLHNDELRLDAPDTAKNDQGADIPCCRHYQVLDMAADGSRINMYLGKATHIDRDDFFHPKTLFKEVVENFGQVPTIASVNGTNEILVAKTMIPSWEKYCQWQADCLTYFMAENKYDVIFSHLHNVDGMGHYMWHYACNQEEWASSNEKAYQQFQEDIYAQTDRYLARFLPYLDQGWTMIITSDHGLITQEHLGVIIGEPGGCNIPVMREMGYTVMKKDAQGNDTDEIDWSKTRAVATRGDHIYINLKGRNPEGIVEPEDRYALEEQIITDLYAYRDPANGKRVISIAMHNKDALLLGVSGPECGDVVYFTAEGYNKIHADSMSTQIGYAGTSVSPIFVAAGPGIKSGCVTERVIRQVDVAPTMAVLAGVRIPAQCEGAPVYQILTENF